MSSGSPLAGERASSPVSQEAPPASHPSESPGSSRWPGGLLCVGLAGAALVLARIEFIGETLHFGPVVLAILLGAGLRATVRLPARLQPGIRFSLKNVLHAAIVLLGFRLSVGEVLAVGGAGLAVVALAVTASLVGGYVLCRQIGLGRKLGLLMSVGCSVCGTSAIVATDAVIGADDEDTTYAIAVVSALGTLLMFLYPLVQAVAGLPEAVYGTWAGASVHSVGQAVAAGFAAGPEAGEVASLVKLTRVLFLVPVTLLLGAFPSLWREDAVGQGSTNTQSMGARVPGFVVGFLAVVVLNSTGLIPAFATEALVRLDTVLLATAMAAIGLETRIGPLRQAGLRPLWAGGLATALLSLLSLLLAVLAF